MRVADRADGQQSLPSAVLIVGKTGAGKSTFIKAATGLDVNIGHSLHACTKDVQVFPINAGIFLIDTPGFEDSASGDSKIFQSIASKITDLRAGAPSNSVRLDLSAMIYIHAIDEVRVTRVMTENLRVFSDLIRDGESRRCAMVTTKWRVTDVKVAEERETELMTSRNYWRSHVLDGGVMMRFEDNRESALHIIKTVSGRGSMHSQHAQDRAMGELPLYNGVSGNIVGKEAEHLRDVLVEELTALRTEHRHTLHAQFAQSVTHMHTTSLDTELKIRKINYELDALRKTIESRHNTTDSAKPDNRDITDQQSSSEKQLKWRRRFYRALRWIGRMLGVGAAIAIAVVTAGTLTSVGIAIVKGIEMAFQAIKNRENALLIARIRDVREARRACPGR